MLETTNQIEAIPVSVPTTSESHPKHCMFRCGDDWYALPAMSIGEITSATPITKIPNSAPSLLGVCHHQSEFIPVISLTKILNPEHQQTTNPNHQYLLILASKPRWAILIDEAGTLVTMETIVPNESREFAASHTPQSGTAIIDDKIVKLLNCHQLYNRVLSDLAAKWSHLNQATRTSDDLLKGTLH